MAKKSSHQSEQQNNQLTQNQLGQLYLSPKQLAKRWDCHQSSVYRYVEQARIPRLCLGSGTRSSIRFKISDIEQFERKQTA